MRGIIFITCTLLSLVVCTLPMNLFLMYKNEETGVFGMVFYLVVGCSNQWIQKKLEGILK